MAHGVIGEWIDSSGARGYGDRDGDFLQRPKGAQNSADRYPA